MLRAYVDGDEHDRWSNAIVIYSSNYMHGDRQTLMLNTRACAYVTRTDPRVRINLVRKVR